MHHKIVGTLIPRGLELVIEFGLSDLWYIYIKQRNAKYHFTSVVGGGGAVDSASSVNSSARSRPFPVDERAAGFTTVSVDSLKPITGWFVMAESPTASSSVLESLPNLAYPMKSK